MKHRTPSHLRTRHVHLTADRDPDRVEALTEMVEAALATDLDHPPTLIAARGDGDQIELLLKTLDHHPAIELEGFVAPASWWCLGIISGGLARALDDGPVPSSPPPPRYPVHLAHVVSRTGRDCRILRDRRTDEVTHLAPVDDDAGGDEHDGGLIDDYLRRALVIPTPPHAGRTTELFAALWIHQLMNHAAVHQLLDVPWPVVAALHPAVALTDQVDEPELRRWATANLVRAGEVMAESHPWGRVRVACQDGIGPFAGSPAELAGWLDDGSFARFVLAGIGPIEDLLADLHHLIRPEVHAQVLDTVATWGLLAPGDP